MKLLFILLLGLGFSQTELTTRLYEYNIELLYNVDYDFTLSEITNGDLDDNQYAFIEILGISDDSQIDVDTWIKVDYRVDNAFYASSALAKIKDLGTSISFLQTWLPERLIYEKYMDHKIFSQEGDFNGTLRFAITAEFPEEDTGYIEEGFEFCVSPGANLLSFPCDNPISVGASLPDGIEDFIESIIGEGVATSYNPTLGWIGSLDDFDPVSGYWFKSNSSLCFEYDCVED